MADQARARKVADRIKVLVAEMLEGRIKDERLGFVTITDVRVTGDLQHASVFYTVFGSDSERKDTADVLEENRGRIRSAVGKGLGIRLTPSLEFIADAIPEGAAHLEEVLAETRRRDAELAAAAQGARFAGDADPYRKPDQDDDLDDDLDDDDLDDDDLDDDEVEERLENGTLTSDDLHSDSASAGTGTFDNEEGLDDVDGDLAQVDEIDGDEDSTSAAR